LSNAEFTFLPVASRFCVRLSRSAVCCSDNRFCRTPEDRVISDMAYLLFTPRRQTSGSVGDPIDFLQNALLTLMGRKFGWREADEKRQALSSPRAKTKTAGLSPRRRVEP